MSIVLHYDRWMKHWTINFYLHVAFVFSSMYNNCAVVEPNRQLAKMKAWIIHPEYRTSSTIAYIFSLKNNILFNMLSSLSIDFDIGLILLNRSFENQYGWTETIPSVFKHETYTPEFISRLQGQDLLIVGMGKNAHRKEASLADGTNFYMNIAKWGWWAFCSMSCIIIYFFRTWLKAPLIFIILLDLFVSKVNCELRLEVRQLLIRKKHLLKYNHSTTVFTMHKGDSWVPNPTNIDTNKPHCCNVCTNKYFLIIRLHRFLY